MAESTTSTSATSTSSTTPPKVSQFIMTSVDDDILQPDAMRGSASVVEAAGIEDKEATRRSKLFPKAN